MQLSHCSSLDCHNYDCDYCQKCSHATFRGQGIDKSGKLWKWAYSPQFGPHFLRNDGEPFINQPSHRNHPAWTPFLKWWKKKK